MLINDKKRHQDIISKDEQDGFMLAISNGVKAIMDELIPGGNLLIQSDLSVLYSEKTGKEQQLHFDYHPLELYASNSYGVIVFLEDNSSLVVLNGTKKETVQCNRGDVIVFRGDKCHAGAEYEYCDNLRFHYYFDSPDSTRKEGETYIKDWFGPQLEEKQSITNKRKRSDEQKLELKEKNIKNLNKRFKK